MACYRPLGWFQKHLAIAGVSAGRDPPLRDRGLHRAIGLLEVRAIAEAALRCGRAHFAKGLGQPACVDRAEAELVDAGAIDEEPVGGTVEASGGRGLSTQAEA